jgi:hypothetical protein
MSDNIIKASDAADAMAQDCQRKIDELEVLKEVYQQMAKSEEYNNDSDNVGYNLKQNIDLIQKSNYPFPIRGIFTLASQFPTENNIDTAIKAFEDTRNYWMKISEQLLKP